jgi:hypothetical protein
MDNLETLEELEQISKNDNTVESTTLQAPKKKKVLSQKQLDVLKNAREKMAMNAKEKLAKKQLEQEEIEKEVQRRLDEERKILEAKILKKAISIKKKEIKKRAILEEISDDDTPMEKIKEIASKPIQRLPPAPVQPKYIYV